MTFYRKRSGKQKIQLCWNWVSRSPTCRPICWMKPLLRLRPMAAFAGSLLGSLKGKVPAVRVSFSAFALLGPEGMGELTATLKAAGDLGFYVAMEAPEILSVGAARRTAEAIFREGSLFPCDGVFITGYLGTDLIKPFLPFCREGKKDLFVISRTANKSASELQDLLSGSRLVHMVSADYVNRFTVGLEGKWGYSSIGVLASASAGGSIRALRSKYPKLFLLLDGYDYPNGSGKNCSYAFDKFGHGAAACAGTSITCAWRLAETDGRDYLEQAAAAVDRMRKNLNRYVTIL